MKQSELNEQPARRGFVPVQNEQERLWMQRTEELCRTAQARGIPRYSNFLSDREQDIARAALNRCACDFGSFRGGFAAAERRVLCLEPPQSWQEEPIAALKLVIEAQKADTMPDHRDCLGALLGLGVDRGCLGDFLQDPENPAVWYVFVLEEKADFFCTEIREIGRFSAVARRCEAVPPTVCVPPRRECKEATVSSLRADAVLAAMLHTSRAGAVEWIESGRVEVNHVPLKSAHEAVFVRDLFTVKGRGRFRLESLGGKSRKDRFFIQFFQY